MTSDPRGGDPQVENRCTKGILVNAHSDAFASQGRQQESVSQRLPPLHNQCPVTHSQRWHDSNLNAQIWSQFQKMRDWGCTSVSVCAWHARGPRPDPEQHEIKKEGRAEKETKEGLCLL